MKVKKEPKSPLKAIRAYCLCCSNNSVKEVSDCQVGEKCSLFKWRFGKNPFTKRKEMTPEQRKILSDRMKKVAKDRLK